MTLLPASKCSKIGYTITSTKSADNDLSRTDKMGRLRTARMVPSD